MNYHPLNVSEPFEHSDPSKFKCTLLRIWFKPPSIKFVHDLCAKDAYVRDVYYIAKKLRNTYICAPITSLIVMFFWIEIDHCQEGIVAYKRTSLLYKVKN